MKDREALLNVVADLEGDPVFRDHDRFLDELTRFAEGASGTDIYLFLEALKSRLPGR